MKRKMLKKAMLSKPTVKKKTEIGKLVKENKRKSLTKRKDNSILKLVEEQKKLKKELRMKKLVKEKLKTTEFVRMLDAFHTTTLDDKKRFSIILDWLGESQRIDFLEYINDVFDVSFSDVYKLMDDDEYYVIELEEWISNNDNIYGNVDDLEKKLLNDNTVGESIDPRSIENAKDMISQFEENIKRIENTISQGSNNGGYEKGLERQLEMYRKNISDLKTEYNLDDVVIESETNGTVTPDEIQAVVDLFTEQDYMTNDLESDIGESYNDEDIITSKDGSSYDGFSSFTDGNVKAKNWINGDDGLDIYVEDLRILEVLFYGSENTHNELAPEKSITLQYGYGLDEYEKGGNWDSVNIAYTTAEDLVSKIEKELDGEKETLG